MYTQCIGDSHVKRLKYLDVYNSSAAAYDIAGLCFVNYFGISGGSISCDHHLGLLIRVVRQHRPQHLIVCLGGNYLDVAIGTGEQNVLLLSLSHS